MSMTISRRQSGAAVALARRRGATLIATVRRREPTDANRGAAAVLNEAVQAGAAARPEPRA